MRTPSQSHVSRKQYIKTTVGHHYTLGEWSKSRSLTTPTADEAMEQLCRAVWLWRTRVPDSGSPASPSERCRVGAGQAEGRLPGTPEAWRSASVWEKQQHTWPGARFRRPILLLGRIMNLTHLTEAAAAGKSSGSGGSSWWEHHRKWNPVYLWTLPEVSGDKVKVYEIEYYGD